jgi:hypothetical protein
MEQEMSGQTHETERLLRRIRELQIEYEKQEKIKEIAYKTLVEKFEAAQERIIELETKYVKKEGK